MNPGPTGGTMGSSFDATNAAVAPIGDRAADDSFRVAEAVDLGGVEEVHAEVEGAMDDLDRGRARVLVAVAPVPRPELPGTDTDHRETLASHLHIAHARILP